MSEKIDYYLSMVSPWTYLGSERLTAMTQQRGIPVAVKPMSTAKVFPVTGGLPLPKRAPARQRYRLVELERWSKRLGLPLNLHPAFFPADDQPAARMVIAAAAIGADALALSNRVLRAVWAEERNVADPETLRAIATEQATADGTLDTAALFAQADKPESLAQYEANTTEAIEREAFGSPFYIWKGEPFWGQDRLDFLEEALDR